MKISILFLLLAIAFSSNAQKLKKIWSSPTDFKTPESVLYNPDLDIVFVANIGNKSNNKDGDGFISQMNIEGDITKLDWVKDLNDPKGMAVLNGKLYVADKNELLVIDIETAKVEKKYLASDAKFLNDVTVCKNGMVFVSDSHAQHIYALSNGEFKLWLQDEKLKGVNGLWTEAEKLYAGNGSVWEIDIASKELKVLFDETGGIDGLETIGDGNFIFSNWSGRIYVSKESQVIKMLDVSGKNTNTADIDYVPSLKLVLVPTFRGNNVDAYQLIW